MKNIKLLSILFSISLIILPFTNTQNLVTGDYSNMTGIQVYFISSSSIYLFGSFTGSSTQITGTLYLFMSDTQSRIDSSNGVWAGVGFGSSDMINSDMVMCTYMPGNKFNCYDTWSVDDVNPKTDVSLGGKNHITASSGTITAVSVSTYKTLVTFTFTKDLTNLDNYDWKNFASWQTNNGGISGAYGYLDGSKTPLEHPSQSKRLTMFDGSGYRSSITVNLGNTPSSATTTTPTTTTPTTTTTVDPNASAATGTTTPTATTTTTTSVNNGAYGLKAFDILAAVLSILLIIFI